MSEMPAPPSGRFKRLWLEMEVEIVDETQLRAFTLANVVDADGNDMGLMQAETNHRDLPVALAQVMAEALQSAQAQTGVKLMSMSGPNVRYVGTDGQYTEFTMTSMPQRNDDGSYDEMAGGE